MFEMKQSVQLCTELSGMALGDPDTEAGLPEGAAGLVDWVKAVVGSVNPEKGDCPSAFMHTKWNAPDKAAQKFLGKPHGTTFMMTKIVAHRVCLLPGSW